MKLLRNITLGIIGAAVLLVAALFAINLKDEDVEAEARAVIEGTDVPKAGERNGFVYAAGLLAPPEQSPPEWGRKKIDRLVAWDRSRPHQTRLPPEDTLKLDYAAWMKLVPCEPKTRDCFAPDEPGVNARALEDWLAANRLLSERCEGLLTATDSWAETYVPVHVESELLAIGQQLSICHQTEFVRAALEQRGGRGAEALRRVLALIAFERRVLANSTTLIGKLVATAQLARTTLFLSDLLRREPALAAATADAMARALRPMEAAERTLAPAFRQEFRLAAATFGDLAEGRTTGVWNTDAGSPSVEDHLTRTPLFRPNATLNRVWPVFRSLIEVDAAPGPEFDAASARQRAVLAALDKPGMDWIYNPIGKQLAALGGTSMDNYIQRMREADALLRLVALQAAVPAGADAEAVRKLAAGPAYLHPSTGKAVEYDAVARTLGYAVRGDRQLPEWIERSTGPRFFKAGRVVVALP